MRVADKAADIANFLVEVLPLFQQAIANSIAPTCKHDNPADNELYHRLIVEVFTIRSYYDPTIELKSESCKKCVRVIQKLLTLFESLLCVDLLTAHDKAPIQKSTARLFPKLTALLTLNVAFNGSGPKLAEFHLQYPNGLVQISCNDDMDKSLLEDIKIYNDKLFSIHKKSGIVLDLDPPIKANNNFRGVFKEQTTDRLRDLTNSLYSSIKSVESQCIRVGGCELPHIAGMHINLFGHSETDNCSEDFLLMLASHLNECTWHEGRIQVKHTKHVVKIREPDELDHNVSSTEKQKIQHIWEHVKHQQENRLLSYLLVEDNALFKVKPRYFSDTQGRIHDVGHPPVSLKTLLAHRVNLDPCPKKFLQLLIARTFVEICEGPWLRRTWGKENIEFFYEISEEEISKKEIDLNRPYFTTDFKFDANEQDPYAFDRPHSHPAISALGILLLEIEMGKLIESTWDRRDLIDGIYENINTNHTTAKRLIASSKWTGKIHQRSRNAIQACLDCKFLDSKSTHVSDEWASKIYDNIIQPLEADWYDCFSDQLEKYRKGNVLEVQGILTHISQDDVGPPPESRRHEPLIWLKQPLERHVDICPRSDELAEDDQLKFFDDILCVNLEKRNLSKAWFSKLNKFFESHIDPLEHLLATKSIYKRSRIAILDTGIDEKHPVLHANSKRIVKKRDWVGDGNGIKDVYATGHGTHTAVLLLKTAPLAEICIARIAKDDRLGNEEHIRDAIQWAVNDCKVDIITMSFGFPVQNNIIHDAIQDAFHKGIIIFAATANDGGNGGVSYPANDPSIVLGINSSDGKGNKSGFSPTPRKRADNYSTLGEAIESSWPDQSGNWKSVFKSGTSYATPIAAGLAATILDYAYLSMDLHDVSLKKLHCYKGMRAVFNLMTDTAERDGYDFVAPWWLWKQGRRIELVHSLITEALRTA